MGQTKNLVDQAWKSLEASDLDGFVGFCRPNVECRQAGMTFRGPAALHTMLEGFFQAFPDMRHEVLDWVEAGDTIALELRITGTHTGTLPTPNGPVPPTGRSLNLESVDYIKMVDGKIASWHAYYDQLSFMAQLGLLPAPAAV
jgi:predicted ester cyclase